MELFTLPNLIAFLTLSAIEIVLGIDNIIFIAIVAGKLEPSKQGLARKIGLALAMLIRIVLLLAISWIMLLTAPLFSVFDHPISGRDLILLLGGMFLIAKATYEVHHSVEGIGHKNVTTKKIPSFSMTILQILMLDIIFSLDSVITAVGMVNNLTIMIAAVVVSVAVMLIFADSISHFIEKHPTFKMLALSFLILVGAMLVIEGCGQHIDKGYIYFAIGFSLAVETLNIRSGIRKKA